MNENSTNWGIKIAGIVYGPFPTLRTAMMWAEREGKFGIQVLSNAWEVVKIVKPKDTD